MRKSIIFSTTLLLSLFVACSNQDEKLQTGSTGSGNSISTSFDEVSVGKPFGTADSPVEVTIMMKDVLASDESTILFVEAVETAMAELGQHVKLTYLDAPSGIYSDVVPVSLRTGQIYPDIIYFQGGDLALMEDGLLEDLTPYLEESTYITALMEDAHKERMKNYPYLLWLAPNRVDVPMIRGDYLSYDSVNTVIDDPSVENYYLMYEDLVSQGVADFGFTTDGNLSRLDSIFNQAFGVTGSFIEKENGYICSHIAEETKNKLEFYAKLYENGLLDPDYITNQWDDMESSFYRNRSATMSGTGGIVYIYNGNIVQANGEEAELVILPPATGISQGYNAIDVTKESRGFAIHSESQVKNEAFAVLEFMASEEGRIIDKLGIENIHYTINDEGIFELTERFPEWWARIWDTYYNFPEHIEFVEQPLSNPQSNALSAMAEHYVKDRNIIFSMELQPTWDGLTMLYDSFVVDIITGKENINSFDDFVEEWYGNGGDTIEAYFNESFSE